MISLYKAIAICSLVCFTILFSCNDKIPATSNNKTANRVIDPSVPLKEEPVETTQEYHLQSPYFSDGIYCASVKYYNENTGTQSLYILNIEVKVGKLTKVQFPNGGWLDDSHFTPPRFHSNGFTQFFSDKGYEYNVLIQHNGPCTSDELIANRFSDTRTCDQPVVDEDEGMSEEEMEEKQVGKELGVVVGQFSGCDYFLIKTRKGLVVAEWMGQYDPDEGDKVRGELSSFGTKYFYVVDKDRTARLWIKRLYVG